MESGNQYDHHPLIQKNIYWSGHRVSRDDHAELLIPKAQLFFRDSRQQKERTLAEWGPISVTSGQMAGCCPEKFMHIVRWSP